jgi:arylsulfatase A-like enzyme
VDEEIRTLFELLAVSPADVVIVTADHGEEFLDHTSFGHSRTLFEEQIHVPLVMRLPGGARAGTRWQEPVSLIDVAPTLLAYLGLAPAPGNEGRALFADHAADWQGARPIRASLSRDHSLESLRLGRWKYIHDPGNPARRWLFDLARDPREQRNLLEQATFAEPALGELLAPLLAWHLGAQGGPRPTPASASLTQDQASQLRSLGYLE